MSEQVVNAADAGNNPSDEAGQQVPEVEVTSDTVDADLGGLSKDELMLRVRNLERDKDVFKKETHNHKRQKQVYKSQLDETKKAQDLEKENYKGLWEQTNSKYEDLRKAWLKDKVHLSVGDVARKAGCRSTEDLMQLGDHELLNFDEETGQVHGADAFVDEAKKSKPWLFETLQPAVINPSIPSGVSTQKTKTFADLSTADKKVNLGLGDLYKELYKGQTK